MKRLIFGLLCISFIFISCTTKSKAEKNDEGLELENEDVFEYNFLPEGAELPVSVFREIWVYVVQDREAALTPGLPVSDIGYFGAEVNLYGTLVNVPDRRNLPAFSGKVHLVVSCHGRALSYFALKPGSPERSALISDLLAAARNFDGLQINFEEIPARAGEPYFTFLQELRAGLGDGKMLSVALQARSRKLENDVYDYEKIASTVDRILVMGYDEHWSSSAPGPIASMPWSRRVAAHSMNVLGSEKLVMGLPFYGRGWSSPSHHQAYIFSGIERIIMENDITEIQRDNGVPNFEYKPLVSVKVYYEDAYSLSARMEMYRSMGVSAIGFWRLGQETQDIWKLLKLEN